MQDHVDDQARRGPHAIGPRNRGTLNRKTLTNKANTVY